MFHRTLFNCSNVQTYEYLEIDATEYLRMKGQDDRPNF